MGPDTQQRTLLPKELRRVPSKGVRKSACGLQRTMWVLGTVLAADPGEARRDARRAGKGSSL